MSIHPSINAVQAFYTVHSKQENEYEFSDKKLAEQQEKTEGLYQKYLADLVEEDPKTTSVKIEKMLTEKPKYPAASSEPLAANEPDMESRKIARALEPIVKKTTESNEGFFHAIVNLVQSIYNKLFSSKSEIYSEKQNNVKKTINIEEIADCNKLSTSKHEIHSEKQNNVKKTINIEEIQEQLENAIKNKKDITIEVPTTSNENNEISIMHVSDPLGHATIIVSSKFLLLNEVIPIAQTIADIVKKQEFTTSIRFAMQ